MTGGPLHVVVPRGIDDPARVSGGNVYDRRLCDALTVRGWQVDVVEVEGGWPWTPDLGTRHLEHALRSLPDGAAVLLDGLLASRLPHAVLPAARRLRLALLVHLPAGVADPAARADEQRVVAAATSVVTPSEWCRDWLTQEYDVDPARVRVAHPGVDPAPLAHGSGDGVSLLTVGAVSPVKGQDRLLAALDRVDDLPWRWTCVGSTSVDREFAAELCRRVQDRGLRDRTVLTGALSGDDLESAYDAADLVVVPSRHETYGMVVTEALARGVPVVAHDVGGVRDALGRTASGAVPGVLVGRTGTADLAAALRLWLGHPDLRAGLRRRALERRVDLTGWSTTASCVADLWQGVAA